MYKSSRLRWKRRLDPSRGPAPVEEIPKKDEVQKVIVAVHGIGDQFNYATVQLVTYQFCQYMGYPAAIPLGAFHGDNVTVTGAYVPHDQDNAFAPSLGFAEIYWADVPRKPAAEGHTLEEPKQWARTLVERVHLRETGLKTASPERLKDYRLVGQVIEEMITGVAIAQRLVFLAEKAGLFKFDLNKLLVDYLDDVQVVTEFEDYRTQLLTIFRDVMQRIAEARPNAEIYIVAHSEGTVVTFLGLLEALTQGAEAPSWVNRIRGLMTIGSPLNKHVVLWGDRLFDTYKAPDPATMAEGFQPIPWRNYYDYGDPIGFDLQMTRDWMKQRGWSALFKFQGKKEIEAARKEARAAKVAPDPARLENHDIGFTRYYFPGEAHNEYWNDLGVFGHFIQTVVDPAHPPDAEGKTRSLPQSDPNPYPVPKTDPLAWLTSYLLPYVLSAGLLMLGVYFLYRAVRFCLVPEQAAAESALDILRNVAGLSALIGGMTVLARLPRLTRSLMWRTLAVAVFATLSKGFYFVDKQSQESLYGPFKEMSKVNATGFYLLIGLFCGVIALLWLSLRASRTFAFPMLFGTLSTVATFLALRRRPDCAGLIAYVLLLLVFVRLACQLIWWELMQMRSGRKLALGAQETMKTVQSGVLGHTPEETRTVVKRTTDESRSEARKTSFSARRLILGMVFAGWSAWMLSPLPYQNQESIPVALAVAIALLAWWTSRYYPSLGLKPLIHTGGLVILVLIGYRIAHSNAFQPDVREKLEIARNELNAADAHLKEADKATAGADKRVQTPEAARLKHQADRSIRSAAKAARELETGSGPIWPVVVAGVAFLYLWWLAALCFDLAFIWHYFIRWSAGAERLKALSI